MVMANRKARAIILAVVIYFQSAGKGQLCTEGDVRLVAERSTVTQREGTVQVCINSMWGSICNRYGWDSREAGVVCRQLGLPSLGAIPVYRISSTYGLVWLDNVRCTGNETHLLNCTHNGLLASSYCNRYGRFYHSTAGVQCLALITSQCSDGDIRLAGGDTLYEGRVEVCYQNSWGTVCDDSWDRRDSMVVCRQLNFTSIGTTPQSRSFYGGGSGGIYLDDVSCSGNEQALINCSHSGIGVHSCTHSKDAGVMCLGARDNCTDGDIRLVSGQSSLEGTVQICVFGSWGTICHNSWDIRDAYVACKQLGYPALGSIPLRYAPFGRIVGPILLDSVQCQGHESSVINCSHSGLGVVNTYCDHFDDVGVQCVASRFAACTDGQLRLVGGSSENEGRVEICYEHQWGTVCDNGWSAEDAKVVCRQLGLQTIGAVNFIYGSRYFGQGTGGILLNYVACSGDEFMLINCNHSGIGVHSCRHSEDAGVICPRAVTDNCTEGQVRLFPRSTSRITGMEGTVQVCVHGYWGTVCHRGYGSSWDSRSAKVVCNQLGYTNYSAIPLDWWPSSGFATLRLPVWLDSVRCSGNEGSLLNCSHSVIGGISTSCNHNYDVGVRCLEPVTSASPCTNGTVRLVGGSTNYEGRVEICYRNQWGTVCDDSWSSTDAQVVCRQLGHTTTSARAYNYAYFGQGHGEIFLDNVACSGTESMLIDCISSSNIGVHNCQHEDDAGVKCLGISISNCTHGDVRLESGRFEREGTVRVCIGGIWSTICKSGWDSRDAAVVCRQLAFPISAAISLSIRGTETVTALVGNFACTGQELSLLDCRYTQITSCSYTRSFAGVQCLDPVNATTPCYDGELRLAGGLAVNEGRVEVCYQNQWGTVCNNGWGSSDARVVCRQLGFNPLGSVSHASYRSGMGGIFLSSVSCSGSEQFLINCTNSRYHTCTHSQDAGVTCTRSESCLQGSARLIHGVTSREGTVEICINGIWGAICDNHWDSRDAHVVCHQLGYIVIGPIPVYNSRLQFGLTTSTRPILLDYLMCFGNETNLLNCTHNGIGVVSSSCGSNDEAGVICPDYEYSDCTDGDIRLTGGIESEGRVEICYHNQWGTICDNNWNTFDAQVVCHQLGYFRLGAISVTNTFFGQGSGGIFLSNVRCNGNEHAVINCSHDGIGVHTCTHARDAGVRCLLPDNCTHGSIRLRYGQTARRGTVEVCVDGYWGTICDYEWDSRDADVVCRQLGFNTFGAIPRRSSYFGRGTRPVVLNSVSCYGNESTILDCSNSIYGTYSRTYCFNHHYYDSGVECAEPIKATATCMDGNIRLIGGFSNREGRVEICYRNQWGSVCNHNWDDLDARVTCRQLGFPPLGGTATRFYYGTAPGAFFLDYIRCWGNETTLISCTHNGIGVHSCTSSQVAAIMCQAPSNCSSGDARLSQGSQGIVEICVNGYWGTVCDNLWDSIDASVVCQQLGYPYVGSIALHQSRSWYDNSGPVQLLDGVSCSGNEQTLLNCTHSGSGVVSPNCYSTSSSYYYYSPAGVQCQDVGNSSCYNGQIRLVDGDSTNEGRVEFCYQDEWGTVCDDYWSDIDAQVVCRQLGFSTIGATAFTRSHFGGGTGGILLDNVRCSGHEQYLVDCAHSAFGVHNCDHSKDAGVGCISLVYCLEELNGGLLWPKTLSNSQISLPCNNAGPHFERHTMTTRYCDLNGIWSDLDLSTCTLVEKSVTFLLVWFMLEENEVPLEEIREEDLEREMRLILSNQSINFTDISFQLSDSLNGTAVTVEITLPSENQTEEVTQLLQYYSFSFSMLGSYAISDNNRGIQAISASSMCACAQSASMTSFIELCSGSTISPCNCTLSLNDCQCQFPFVGDGNRCTLDTDGDGYPDIPLDSPTCNGPQEISINYCKRDTCPTVANADQRPEDCQPLSRNEFDGCPFEIDDIWGTVWPNTPRGSSSEQRCPGGIEVLGNATRFCDNRGQWGQANVLNCTSPEFTELEVLAEQTLSSLDPEEQVEQVTEVAQRLAQATERLSNKSLLPNDLGASARIVTDVITVLENTNSTNENVIEIFNNILDDNNREGWQTLQSTGLSSSSELLLSSAERYAMVAISSVNTSGGGEGMQAVRQSRLNIVVVGEKYREPPSANLQFPTPADLVNYTNSTNTSTITIPSSLVKERLREVGNDDNVPVFFVLLRNLPMGTFAVNKSTRAIAPCTGQNFTTQGASDVIAAQLGARDDNRTFLGSLQESPISLNFTFESTDNTVLDSYSCVFWNFSVPIGNGSWITDGVVTNDFTTQNTKTGRVTTVRCSTTHLTSFAVLVDVAGGLEVISKAERVALQVVSYVGCGISIVCLSVTVIFFLWQGYYQRRLPDSKRVKSVQNFIHLNLSLSLLLAFIVFVLGVETATGSEGGCAFVAAILHYLFLCAFCWMLCEGILLYLLLRVVFSEMSKKWWPFLLIGYLTPVPIVVITIGARYKYYGVRDSCGDLLYCWLSLQKGTIFGFVAPMLAIILVNVFFMVLALHTLLKARRNPIEQKNDSTLKASTELGRALFVAMLVLLPLLGLAWAFGILTVNANSTPFAWLFTFFNSLQGLFIFAFHVIRSDKVWSKISPKLHSLKSKVTTASGFRWYDNMSTGFTGTLTRGKSTGTSTLPQDPNSTLGRGGLYKKGGLSSSVDAFNLISTPIASSYELKSDLHPVSNLTETESETEAKIDLGSSKTSMNADAVEPVKIPCEKLDEEKSKEIDPTNDGSSSIVDRDGIMVSSDEEENFNHQKVAGGDNGIWQINTRM